MLPATRWTRAPRFSVNYCACRLIDLAQRLRQALDATLNIDKVRTGDLGGSATTSAFTKALVSRIASA